MPTAMSILNAANVPLNANSGTVPNMLDAIANYFQPMTLTTVGAFINGTFQISNSPTPLPGLGIWQPMEAEKLVMLPSEQRSWTWWTLHCDPSIVLSTDDVFIYLTNQYRVMRKNDCTLYGFIEYSVIADYSGSGPG